MRKNISPWGKAVKTAMIQRNWTNKNLADAAHLSREYVSAVVNGRVISQSAIKAISDALGISEPACSSDSIV